MPSANSASSSSSPMSLKWTTQRIKPGRVHKRSASSASSSSRTSKKLASHSSATTTKRTSGATREDTIRKLESELTFTYDALATINVMFTSLQHAYTSSQDDMQQSYNATRLSDKEKELLAAYDDLRLQVTHLERQLVTLEKRLKEVRASAPSPVVSKATPAPSVIQDTASCATTASPATLLESSPVFSPPCSPYLSYPPVSEAVTPSPSCSLAFYPEPDMSFCQEQPFFQAEQPFIPQLYDLSSMVYDNNYWAAGAPF